MWNERYDAARRQSGLTLMELIVAMVIVSVAVAGMIAAFTRADRASVDPVIHKQMATLAEGMMEEILLKPFTDPTPAEIAATRAEFDHVSAFNNFAMSGVTTVNGDTVPDMSVYSVAVRVVPVTLADATAALAITVTVRRGADVFTLTGWRTNYAA